MNVAVFSHYFSPEIGAPSARVHDMAREWVAIGHEAQVVTCFPNHPIGQIYPGYTLRRYAMETIDSIAVHRNVTYVTRNAGLARKTLGHASFWPSACIHSLPRMKRPDVAIGTSPTFFAAMSAASARRRFRIPFVMEVRDLWPACFVDLGVLRNRSLLRLLELWELRLYRQADHIVTVTDAFKRNLIERGVPSEKITSIPNGADENFWSPQPRSGFLSRASGRPDGFNVLYIGAHGISQGLSYILDSARLLRDLTDVHFFFVGEGAQKSELEATAQAMRLSNVSFLGPVDKKGVRDCYSDADACLVPLRNIPLFRAFIPSKMFEMLSMGCPIVASVDGEAAAILRSSGGALVVPPEDSKAIAKAVCRLHEDRELADNMGLKGREYVTRHFSRRMLASQYIETLRSVVSAFR